MNLKEILSPNEKKIFLIVLDGLGDLPERDKGGLTPLEYAYTPNLDSLAKKSALGCHIPVDYGITPGSGPGHLALFGYDPKKIIIGRGVLEALGVEIELKETDLAVRANFATAEYRGGVPIIIDRRAGRIPTEENQRLVSKLSEKIKEIDGVKVILKSGREHRFVVVFRFPEKLSEKASEINDTDPQKTGVSPLEPEGKNEEAKKVASVVKKFLKEALELLKEEKQANYILLRGFSVKPSLEEFDKRYKVSSCAIAVYPMYKGLASLVGMEIIKFEGERIEDEIKALRSVLKYYTFFFFHIKKSDSFGEDGNFEGKVKIIEEFDKLLPEILALEPDVLCITGDHSTPCKMASHSWHPVPVLIHSPYVLGETCTRFTEREALKGELGIFPGVKLMPLLLAHAGKMKKFGA